MLFKPKRHRKRTILEEIEKRVLCFRKACNQIECLCEDRFANQEGRLNLLDSFDGPEVMPLRSIEKSDERSGINDGAHRVRNL